MQKNKLIAVIFVYLIVGCVSDGFLVANTYFFKSQIIEHPSIDALIEKADTQFTQENYPESERLYQMVLQESEKKNYSKGLVHAFLGFSRLSFVASKLELSTDYLVRAKVEPYAQGNPKILGKIYFYEALNLHSIGLLDQAIERYHEGLKMLETIKEDQNNIDEMLIAYNNIGDAYQLLSEKDSALYYYKYAFYASSKDFNSKFTSAASIADLYIDYGLLDSAKNYLSFTDFYAQHLDTNYAQSIAHEIKGKYYQAIGQFDEAIALYTTSIEINDQLKRPRAQLLKFLSEAYRKNGDEKAANEYLKKYVEVKDSLESISLANMKALPTLMDNVQNESKTSQTSHKWYYITAILLILTAAYLYIKYLKIKRRKGKQENIQLKKKLNNAFEEVVELAESNSPNFLARFIEVYPELYNQLITEYPDLTTADIKVCALLKLDYSTKEIAEITFSSLRTVQNRMYKLRKKLKLNSDEKLDRWIQNFHIESLNQI